MSRLTLKTLRLASETLRLTIETMRLASYTRAWLVDNKPGIINTKLCLDDIKLGFFGNMHVL